MNLDPRIKSKNDILTCFDIEKAKEFVGQNRSLQITIRGKNGTT